MREIQKNRNREKKQQTWRDNTKDRERVITTLTAVKVFILELLLTSYRMNHCEEKSQGMQKQEEEEEE